MKTVLLSAGRKDGNSEILGKHALIRIRERCGGESAIIRLQELHIEQCTGCESCMRSLVSGGDGKCVMGDRDDFWWLLEQLSDADALLLSAPVYDLIPSGNLITLLNRALGAGRDYRNSCKKQKKIGAVIAVGGSDWINLTEPLMNLSLTNLCKGSVIVDRMILGGNTAPAMVLLDEDAMDRAAQLGDRVAAALLNRGERSYKGGKGVCPSCHCNLLQPLGGNKVACPFCNARGEIRSAEEGLQIDWDEESIAVNRFSEEGELKHQADIREANQRAFGPAEREIIKNRKKYYMDINPYIRPERM